MNPTLSVAIACSRERELRAVVRRPDRLMAHTFDLVGDTSPDRRRTR